MSGIHLTPRPFGFIQARYGSTRLPGKILECIPQNGSDTLLDHIHFRLSKILPKDHIVFLIPEKDSHLEDFLKQRGYLYFLGSEDDVRDRYIKAAEKFGAEHIIRLTGDNPFIDITSIELLWEAMFHVKAINYCLSMQGLPLGMGVECFSYAALKQNIDKYKESRHTEHVSLHIKENLAENAIFRLTPPHLNDKEQACSAEIRMTIDTPLDLKMMRDLWEEFGGNNSVFGAKEVIQLFLSKPEIFSTNRSVEQIRFDLPKDTNSKKKISMTYGEPALYGSGHFERCKSLSIELQMAGFDILCNPEEKKGFDAFIIDAREREPIGFPALLIDSLLPPKEKTIHINLLPHPEDRHMDPKDRSFYCSPTIDLFKNQITNPGQWMVYAGSLNSEICAQLDQFLLNFLTVSWDVKQWIRVGGSIPQSSLIQYFPRLTKYEYFELLSRSEGFLSYFGQSVMESIYLEKKTVLFGMTEIHKKLGEYFANLANLTYIGEPYHFHSNRKLPFLPRIHLNRNGHLKIIKWAETL